MMITCTLNGKPFEFDETLPYYDFHVSEGQPHVSCVNAAGMIGALADFEARESRICWNQFMAEAFKIWSRWVHEAPRKRFYRDMIRAGRKVLSAEYFFPDDAGANIIDGLENWGKLCVRVLEQFGEKGVGPIRHDDPIRPTTIAEILGEEQSWKTSNRT